MGLLANLKTDDTIADAKEDVTSGSFILPSNLYDFTIELAYIGKSSGGAMSLNLHLTGDNGTTIRQTVYVTSGDAKGNLNYYVDKKKVKQYLPGFNIGNSLCLLTAGKEIGELDTEEKVVNLYDFDAGKELPTKVNAITDIMGKQVTLGVNKQTVDKNVKQDDGTYAASGEIKEENEIDRVFRSTDGLTVTEIKAESIEPAIKAKWLEKWLDVTKNKAKGTAAGATGAVAGAPVADKPKKSLFA